MKRQAGASVAQIRQTTQYTCCAASIASALAALGKQVTEDEVNRVLGAAPMAGASWEAMLAAVQYFGCRGTLVVPATPRMLKGWTDRGLPVIIGWNPEGRPWSHASTVFDVVEEENGELQVHVMDPNIPNPSRTTRVLHEDDFCARWSEKVSDALIVRRPAMVVELEVSRTGRQVVASAAPMPRLITKAPMRYQKRDGDEAAWGRVLEDLLHGSESDTRDPKTYMSSMGPWYAGYQLGHTPKDDREAVQHYMAVGSLVLSLSHHYGYGDEAEREWRDGFENGRRNRAADVERGEQ